MRAFRNGFLEPISKIGFWFKIPSSPKGFAGTRAAGPSLKPQAYCCMSRILNETPTKILGQKTFLSWVLKKLAKPSPIILIP